MVHAISNCCQVSLKTEQNTTSEFPFVGNHIQEISIMFFSNEIKEEICCFVTLFESDRLNV